MSDEWKTDTPRTDGLIHAVMQSHKGTSKYAQAVYFEDVHQELAPHARVLEKEVVEFERVLEEIAAQHSGKVGSKDRADCMATLAGVALRNIRKGRE